MRSRFLTAAVLLLLACVAPAFAELRADELLLIVNRNVPEGRALAEHYARVRGVPDGRILELDLPTGESLDRHDFDEKVKPVVRARLAEEQAGRIRCLLTFHGVPLIVGPRELSTGEKRELAEIDSMRQRAVTRLAEIAGLLEVVARRVDPAFQPLAGDEPVLLLQRIERAVRVIQPKQQTLDQPTVKRLDQLALQLQTPLVPATRPATSPAELQHLTTLPNDPDARSKLRHGAASLLPLAPFVQLLEQQRRILDAAETDASFDSELSMVLTDNYPLHRWINNPLYFRRAAATTPAAPVLMTCRLDATTPAQVRSIIDTSLRVERAGLRGIIAIDSRGLPATRPDGSPHGYGWYDQTLRNLADLLRQNDIAPRHDDGEQVFTPNAIDGIAVYAGWYSVRNYIPPGRFVDGAVGFHVASFELTTLRNVNDKGWVRSMINDGVVATLGPVSEPYLHAFPRADEFFPLLLTGELTLAEVFWRTNLITSWKIALIGDPLYRPFRRSPLLKPDALPEPLRGALKEPVPD
jgi:uncharacterized protein (TIGR03790 family)